jgi:hypothetical protein
MTEYVHHYAFGKLHDARDSMASSPKSLRERLSDAFLSGLLQVRSDDLPDDIAADFETLTKMVSTEPPNSYRGSIEVTLTSMHWTKVHKCAQLLINIVNKAEHRLDPKFDYWRAA